MSFAISLLGTAAGMMVTCAALPRVWSILRDPDRARGESAARNAMIVVGNAMWVLYGLLAGAPVIAIMCAVAAGLNGLILAASVRGART
jgi:uncharacterized protein with PQ loop repeat